MTKLWMAFSFLIALYPLHAAPNLSGEWKLNLAKSEYGTMPAPVAVTRKIRQDGGSLSMSTYQRSQQREVTSELSYTTDGTPVINKMSTGEVKGTARWDGGNLVIESSQIVQNAEIKSKEVWTLSADGRTLTIRTHLTLPQQGEFDVKQVFEKQ